MHPLTLPRRLPAPCGRGGPDPARLLMRSAGELDPGLTQTAEFGRLVLP